MSKRYVLEGQVYKSVAGSPNVRVEPEQLDCSNYFTFHKVLLELEGRRVRITIDTLDNVRDHPSGAVVIKSAYTPLQ